MDTILNPGQFQILQISILNSWSQKHRNKGRSYRNDMLRVCNVNRQYDTTQQKANFAALTNANHNEVVIYMICHIEWKAKSESAKSFLYWYILGKCGQGYLYALN